MTDSTLNRFMASGTNAQRLAFTPSPPTPASGPNPAYFWYETDTGNTYVYASGAWAPLVGASGTISRVTCASSQTSITFSSLSGFTDIDIDFNGTSQSGSQDQLRVQFNADTGSNYAYNFIRQIDNAGTSSANNHNDTSIIIGYTFPISGGATVTDFHGTISRASGTTFRKALSGSGGAVQKSGGSFSGQYSWSNVVEGYWDSAAAITSIKLFWTSGSAFTNGSVAAIRGWA